MNRVFKSCSMGSFCNLSSAKVHIHHSNHFDFIRNYKVECMCVFSSLSSLPFVCLDCQVWQSCRRVQCTAFRTTATMPTHYESL